MDEEVGSPNRGRKFWLSDYIYQNRHCQQKIDKNPRLGIARRMPRVNRRHEKLFEDTLKMLNKSGQPSQIAISFEDKFRIRNKSTNSTYETSRYRQSSPSPHNVLKSEPSNKFKRLSLDLLDRIKTEIDTAPVDLLPKVPLRYNKKQQRAAFQMKASDQWMHAQQQILKINIKQELIRLEKRRIKKIQLGIDNRSIDDLINQLKN